jgi:hypothetical protein
VSGEVPVLFQVGDEEGRAGLVDDLANRLLGAQHGPFRQDAQGIVHQPRLVAAVEFAQHRQVHVQRQGRLPQDGPGTSLVAQIMAGHLLP